MVKAARECGYLKDMPEIIDSETAKSLPRNKILLITTGSQGEPRSALPRIANQQHPAIDLDFGDTVIFSSRVIPGNERSIAAMQNRLVERGIKIITAGEEDIHVSGHPGRDELAQMYTWLKPTTLIPVHGEARHMYEQARLGLSCGIKNVLVPKNGSLIELTKDGARQLDLVQAGRWGWDGCHPIPMDGLVLRERQRLSISGTINVSAVLSKSGVALSAPQVSSIGICETKDKMVNFHQLLQRGIKKIIISEGKNLNRCEKEIYQFCSREARQFFDKRPMVSVHLLQV